MYLTFKLISDFPEHLFPRQYKSLLDESESEPEPEPESEPESDSEPERDDPNDPTYVQPIPKLNLRKRKTI